MCVCVHTYKHTYIPTYLPTYVHTYIRTYIYTYTHMGLQNCLFDTHTPNFIGLLLAQQGGSLNWST